MKLRTLLLCGVCALSASLAMAQNQTFPFTLTTADGLPEQTQDAAKSFTQWVSPTYTFDEPVSSFRLTVTHTSWQDAFNQNANGGRGYVFFTMGEFYLYDAAGNQVELTEDNFTSNAAEAMATNDGCIANLVDGDTGTHFHSSYNNTDAENPIGAEHYLEITLPEPMQSFSFGFVKRNNNANIPCEIIVTKGGVDADPWADYEFQLGEKTTDIEPGHLYVLCDDGNVEAYNGTKLYVAPNGQPGYFSEAGQTHYHVRRNAAVDCIYIPISAGDGSFYLKNYLTGTFIGGAAGFQEQVTTMANAAKLVYDPENYSLDGVNGYHYSTNSQASFVSYENTTAPRSMYFYEATISSKYAFKEVEKAVADAEEALATYKEKFADGDDGETTALEEALAAAKAVNADSPCNELFAAATTLNSATATFLTIQIYLFIDEIADLLDTTEFGTTFGCYPIAQQTILNETLEKLLSDVDNRSFESLEDVKNYIASIQNVIDTFEASKITDYSEWPLHLVGENGAVLFTQMEGLGNYIYKSPTFYLEEPIERLYITTVATNTGDAGGGWPCTNWAHFTLYDGAGEVVDLYESDFSTNALEPGDGQGIAGICDFNEDGTPNLTTYLHTLYSSSDKSTNEHYICVEFPEPMNLFSFDLISRDNGRLVPTEMVIDSAPYHYEPEANISILKQVTDVAELDPEKFYLFYGNINVVTGESEGSGYYSAFNKTNQNPQSSGVFQIVPSEEDGFYKIHFVESDVFLAQPTAHQYASVVGAVDMESAGNFAFAPSDNLEGAFKVYAVLYMEGEPQKVVIQDWSGQMGYYPIAGEGFENDDTDGESDWTIFEVTPLAVPVYVSQIKSASQINTEDKYVMYGNLEVVSAGKEGSGFYRGVGGTVDGELRVYDQANNYTLFKFEAGANGGYKIHFLLDDNYLVTPGDWEGASVTDDPAQAGEFFVEESENLAGAFKIYAKGKFTGKNNVDTYTDADAKFMVQDWGDSMGYYPIVCDGFADDDTDGESDWTLFKQGDPNSEELFREDYLGDYVWTYDNYWDVNETKTCDVTLTADPESTDGIIIPDFFGTGYPLIGRFDGNAHTITFPGMQQMNSDETYTYYFRSVTSDTADITFLIDLTRNNIKYTGQAGFIYHNDVDLDNEWPYWKDLSASYIELVPTNTHVENAVVSDAEVLNVTYFTIGGQVSAAPVQGINIVRSILSDGSVRVEKILVK